jgi:hypothetical protein
MLLLLLAAAADVLGCSAGNSTESAVWWQIGEAIDGLWTLMT